MLKYLHMTTVESITLTSEENRIVHAMQLLGDSTRFKMFKILCSNQDLCVSEMATRLGISPSAVSQHFRSFEMLGLVTKERSGQKICYVFTDDNLVSELIKLTKK
jgi:DNA-binding transcriptional ArsR family regulator